MILDTITDVFEKHLDDYESAPPEILFEWRDVETDAVGWLVIDSLKHGSAAGGTRMKKGLDKQEIISLAKTMGIKFSAMDVPIGGAKSGINFDPKDPRKREVLRRWYQAISPFLKNYYGTGGDLYVDELREVIPLTKEVGIKHPLEGVLRGTFHLNDREILQRIKQLQLGVSKPIVDHKYAPHRYPIADMITGYGVAEAISCYYELFNEKVENKKVVIQGWGTVGAAAGYYLSQYGFKIVGILEHDYMIINSEGFSFEQIKDLFINRSSLRTAAQDFLIPENKFDKDPNWFIESDIFVPSADSGLISDLHVNKLLSNGIELIAPGANVPFNDDRIFYGSLCQFLDKKISVIPDFVANCGMARLFWYLMQKDADITDESIFRDTSIAIRKLMEKSYKVNPTKNNITKAFLSNLI